MTTAPLSKAEIDLAEQNLARRERLSLDLAAPDLSVDERARLARECARRAPLAEAFSQWRRAEDELRRAAKVSDPELQSLVAEETAAWENEIAARARDIRASMAAPPESVAARNCFVEIRAAVGGEESSLFATDLARMYARYAEAKRWQWDVLSTSIGAGGGLRELIARVSGADAYAALRFESGAHRVQRVPKTESQGRIHTSAATVAVLPEIEDDGDEKIDPGEIRVDTFRASGAGGQHVNTTDSAVRATHLPTGVSVECQNERSQHKNRAAALAVLRARVFDARRREKQNELSAERKRLVGSGDRSERVRTYNFMQSRVTDHRIGLTLYKLERVLEGDLDDFCEALAAASQAARSASPA